MNPWKFTRSARHLSSLPVAGARMSVKRTSLGIEALERRELLAIDSLNGLHNSALPTDVNNDGRTTNQDVQAILNELNARGAHRMSIAAAMVAAAGLPGESNPSSFTDVNNDGIVSPLDALLVVNQINALNENALAKVELELTDMDGNAITRAQPGQLFQLKVYIDDVRPGAQDQGAYFAYVDILFDAALAEVEGNIVHSSDYNTVPLGNTSTDGVIDTAGGTSPLITPLGPQRRLLFSVTMVAESVGNLTFQSTLPSTPGTGIGLFDADELLTESEVEFGSATLEVYAPTMTISNTSVVEGDSGQKVMVFTVTLSEQVAEVAFAQWQTVELTGESDAATAGVDYETQNGVVIFTGDSLQQTFTVVINGDTVPELNERFKVVLSNAQGAILGNSEAIGTILDDDTEPTVTIESPEAIVEGDSGTHDLLFTVRLSQASTKTVTVNFETADGTALAGSDFEAKTGTLTFAPGEIEKTIAIAIVGDTLPEAAQETFAVRLTGATNAVLSNEDEATGIIQDDDEPPVIAIVESGQVAEGDSGTTLMNFLVTLSKPSSLPVTVSYSTTALTATGGATDTTPGADFVLQSGQLTFEPGEVEKTISIVIIGDTAIENDESFVVLLDPESATNATVGLHAASAGLILNDDLPIISIDNQEITEGNDGTKLLVFTVSLSEPSPFDVAFDYATEDGTATAGEDYEAKQGALTILAGQTQATISIVVIGDTVEEDDEAFSVTLSNIQGASIGENTATATGTILDDDGLPRITIDNVSKAEGNQGETTQFVFTVKLSSASEEAVTVTYQTAAGTATDGVDYTGIAPTVLTFEPGQTEKTIVVEVIGDDGYGPDETFSVVLSNAVNARVVAGNGDVGVGTIVNDDDAPIVTVSTPEPTTEPAAATNLIFIVSIDGLIEVPFVVNYTTEDISATAGQDYTTAAGVLTFEVDGPTSQQIAVPILPDNLDEPTETFRVRLSRLGETLAEALGTILDDEDPAPTISIATPGSITEGNDGTKLLNFVVSLSGPSGRTIEVDYNTVAGTATAGTDFESKSGKLTFAPGEAQKTISIVILGDTTIELDETFQVVLDAESATNATVANGAATGTIVNDDFPTISVENAEVVEGNDGTTELVFTVKLSQAAPFAVTLNFNTADGTATAGSDYDAKSGSITFEPGETQKTISVAVRGDTVDEPNETLTLALTNVQGATPGALNATGTILDDDVSPTVNIGNATVSEGNNGTKIMTFTVTLSEAPTQTVTMKYTTQDGTAVSTGTSPDYVAQNGTLTFTPGGPLSQTIEIVINGDATFEPDEAFKVVLSDLSTGITPGVLEATGTITNDDAAPSITLDAIVEMLEGNAGETKQANFIIRLSNPSSQAVTGTFRTFALNATADVDYISVNQNFEIPAGQTEIVIPVTIVGDSLKEAAESFQVRLSNVSGATVGDKMQLDFVILNDDQGVSVSGYTFVDSSGNGRRDNGEVGLPRVTIHLIRLNTTGQPIETRTTVTDARGRYQFDDVPGGIYAIVQEQPAGYDDGLVAYGTGGQNLGFTNNRLEVIVGTQNLEDYNFAEANPKPSSISKKNLLGSNR